MHIELVKYAQETAPHSFEAHVSTDDIKAENERRHGSATVGRIKIYDEETGKFSWFVIGARLNGAKQPIIEVVNIRQPQDKTAVFSGVWRTPDAHDLVRAENEAL